MGLNEALDAAHYLLEKGIAERNPNYIEVANWLYSVPVWRELYQAMPGFTHAKRNADLDQAIIEYMLGSNLAQSWIEKLAFGKRNGHDIRCDPADFQKLLQSSDGYHSLYSYALKFVNSGRLEDLQYLLERVRSAKK